MNEELLEAINRRRNELEDAAHSDLMRTIAAAGGSDAADNDGGDEGDETFAAFARRMDIDVDTATADQLKAAVKLFDVVNKGKKRASAAASNAEIQTEILQGFRDELIAESREKYLHRNRGDKFGDIMAAIRSQR